MHFIRGFRSRIWEVLGNFDQFGLPHRFTVSSFDQSDHYVRIGMWVIFCYVRVCNSVIAKVKATSPG